MERIGICDWGIGGIGVYQQLLKLGNFDVVYFSDAGFTPYGKVSDEDLRLRWHKVKMFFEQQGVRKIIVACNALSTVVEESSNHFTVIASGIDEIKKLAPLKVGVTGGFRTINSNAYKNPLESKGITVIQSIGQVLSARIEAGDIYSKETKEDITNVFEPFREVDTVLLACTHYPVLSAKINELFPHLTLIDPSYNLAIKVQNRWGNNAHENNIKWFTSGETEGMVTAARISFGQEVLNPLKISL
jgi:glutamate racemase